MFSSVVVLAAVVFISVGLRYLIIGEIFDRALHSIDPAYRNLRDMGGELLSDPIRALRRLPRSYVWYSGHLSRAVHDPDVERLRHRARRAALDVGVFGVGGFIGVFIVAGVLRRISPELRDLTVIAAEVSIALFWMRRLVEQVRQAGRSPMVVLYVLAGIGAATGAIAFTVLSQLGVNI